LAAEEESQALKELDPSEKQRTFGITIVSATSLWYKAHEYQEAKRTAYIGLVNENLPKFAEAEIQDLLQYIWNEEARKNAGVDFTEGEVLISVSGGVVVVGGAPLELILRKVDEVSKIFYRTIEFVLDRPFRLHGAPSLDIQEQFKPWLFQAPAGSYQFAVRVERPKQMSLFPDALPKVDKITEKFLNIIKASVEETDENLVKLVPNIDYRNTFLKLTRNLAPTGKQFEKLEINAPYDPKSRPIVLIPESREFINKSIKKPKTDFTEELEEKTIQLRGVLRGLQLDKDWLDIDEEGDPLKPIRILNVTEAIDDVIGPMVNRRVIVDVIEKTKGKYYYKDIQMEE
jgi:hypothetical protein